MRKIVLEKNKKRTITDQYGEKIVVANVDDKYYISASNQTFGPFREILYVQSKDNNNDLFFNGFNLTKSVVLRMGYDGIKLVEEIDTSEIVENVIRKHAKFINFDDCEFLGAVGNYRLYKDLQGRFFAVDITKPLKPETKYRKFDSYTELIYHGYINGVKLYNQDVSFEYENKPIKDYLTDLKKNMAYLYGNSRLIERANIILPKIQWLKKVVGVENFIKGNFDLKIYKSGYKIIDMKQSIDEILSYDKIDKSGREFIAYACFEDPDLFRTPLSQDEILSNTFIRQLVKKVFDKYSQTINTPAIQITIDGRSKVYKFDTTVIEEIKVPKNCNLVIKSIHTNKKSCKDKEEYITIANLIYKKLLEMYKQYIDLNSKGTESYLRGRNNDR